MSKNTHNCDCCRGIIWNKNKNSDYCENCAHHLNILSVKLRWRYYGKKIKMIKKSSLPNKEEVLKIMENA